MQFVEFFKISLKALKMIQYNSPDNTKIIPQKKAPIAQKIIVPNIPTSSHTIMAMIQPSGLTSTSNNSTPSRFKDPELVSLGFLSLEK